MATKRVTLSLPADEEYVLLARMAMSGLGMVTGLEVDLIDDLRMAVSEIFDCLFHQRRCAEGVDMTAECTQDRLCCRFTVVRGTDCQPECAQDLEITRGVLATLLPDVTLTGDDCGVREIAFSLPLQGAEAL